MGLLNTVGTIETVMILGSLAAVLVMAKEILDLRRRDKKKGENMEWDKSAIICGNCMWWDRVGWCCLEPVKVPKMYDDFCSHWTAKQLNEVQPLNEVKP